MNEMTTISAFHPLDGAAASPPPADLPKSARDTDLTKVQTDAGVRIYIDGRGWWVDGVFIERLRDR